jgi:hypothetical protein
VTELSINITGLNLPEPTPEPVSVPAPAPYPESTPEPTVRSGGGEVCELCIGSCMNSEECSEGTAYDLCLEMGEELDDHMCETTMEMGGATTCECSCNIQAKRGLEKVRMEYFV